MIHHAIFGSLGRMIAILLEHHGGALPFWLSPDQVAVAPISKDQAGYGADVLAAFEDAGIRAVAYDGAETLSRRIVTAHEMAVPVMAIVGGREMRDGRVSPARARRLTGRRSAGRGGVPPASEGPAWDLGELAHQTRQRRNGFLPDLVNQPLSRDPAAPPHGIRKTQAFHGVLAPRAPPIRA